MEPPDTLTTTRIALHRLATYVIAPVRYQATGRFGLRWTPGGFGTPFFPGPDGRDRQIRVEGITLVEQRGRTDEQRDDQVRADVEAAEAEVAEVTVRTAPISTLRAAADFLGTEVDEHTAAEPDSPPVGDPDAPLEVDEAAARFLGEWYGMAFAALGMVRADAGSVDPSHPQLWPGHFDPAIEVGDEVHRASYGASPGDGSIDEPYIYLSIWWPDRIGIDGSGGGRDPEWNSPSFTGAILRLSDFPPNRDPVEAAAKFWFDHRDRLGRY